MKYLIIDAEKLKSWKDYHDKQNNIEALSLLESLKLDGAILSEEESLKKFKEVWQAGSDECYYTTSDRCDWNNTIEPPDWENYKKTL